MCWRVFRDVTCLLLAQEVEGAEGSLRARGCRAENWCDGQQEGTLKMVVWLRDISVMR